MSSLVAGSALAIAALIGAMGLTQLGARQRQAVPVRVRARRSRR